MQEIRETEQTAFRLSSYPSQGGWKWEIKQQSAHGEPSIFGVSRFPFLSERDAFADGLRMLEGLAPVFR